MKRLAVNFQTQNTGSCYKSEKFSQRKAKSRCGPDALTPAFACGIMHMRIKQHYHHKYGRCEQCGGKFKKGGLLISVEFWKNDYDPSSFYQYVCESCHSSLEDWCKTNLEDRESFKARDFGNKYTDKNLPFVTSANVIKKMYSKCAKLTSFVSFTARPLQRRWYI